MEKMRFYIQLFSLLRLAFSFKTLVPSPVEGFRKIDGKWVCGPLAYCLVGKMQSIKKARSALLLYELDNPQVCFESCCDEAYLIAVYQRLLGFSEWEVRYVIECTHPKHLFDEAFNHMRFRIGFYRILPCSIK